MLLHFCSNIIIYKWFHVFFLSKIKTNSAFKNMDQEWHFVETMVWSLVISRPHFMYMWLYQGTTQESFEESLAMVMVIPTMTISQVRENMWEVRRTLTVWWVRAGKLEVIGTFRPILWGPTYKFYTIELLTFQIKDEYFIYTRITIWYI